MTPKDIRVLCLQLADACISAEAELEARRKQANSGNSWPLETDHMKRFGRRYRRLLLNLQQDAKLARQYVVNQWNTDWILAKKKDKR